MAARPTIKESNKTWTNGCVTKNKSSGWLAPRTMRGLSLIPWEKVFLGLVSSPFSRAMISGPVSSRLNMLKRMKRMKTIVPQRSQHFMKLQHRFMSVDWEIQRWWLIEMTDLAISYSTSARTSQILPPMPQKLLLWLMKPLPVTPNKCINASLLD